MEEKRPTNGCYEGGLPSYLFLITFNLALIFIHHYYRYQDATVAAERMRSLAALAFAREPYLLQRTLRLSLSELVRSQDTVRLVARVANNPIGTELAWDFFRENYVEFYRRYEHSTFLLESLIKAVSEQFSTELKLAEVQNFFKGASHHITILAGHMIKPTQQRQTIL